MIDRFMPSESPAQTRIFGILEFEEPIICAADTLGWTERIVIGGLAGCVKMPSLPSWGAHELDPLNMPLLAPEPARTWKRGDKPIHWGQPVQFPSGTSRVERLLLEFPLPVLELMVSSDRVRAACNGWQRLFIEYLELLTQQRRTRGIIYDEVNADVELICLKDDGRPYRLPESRTHHVTVRMNSAETNLGQEQFRAICAYCSTGAKPAIEYRIMLEAYRALKVGDYRKAIIESATSAELALSRAIKSKLAESGVSFAEQLLGKFRMLSGRFELARIVGIVLPDVDYKALLIEPRNHIVHRANFADESAAESVIRTVDELLVRLSPEMAER